MLSFTLRMCERVCTWSEFQIPLLRNGELAHKRSFWEEKQLWCIAVAVFFPCFPVFLMVLVCFL